MLRDLLPESLFGRPLSDAADRRVRLAQARAEEALVRTHVENALSFVDALAEDLPFDRAIDTYLRVMALPEPLAGTVVTRVLVALGQELLPARRGEAAVDDTRPRLRLADASAARASAASAKGSRRA